MSRRYFLNGSIFDYVPSLGYVDYDDIVDKSSFVLDSETTRQRILSGSVGSSSKLLYDSDSSNQPSDFVVSLRQGKLDKAEVYQHQLALQDEIKHASNTSKAKAKLKSELDSIAHAKDVHSDSVTSDTSSVSPTK